MKLGSELRWGAPALAAGLLMAATASARTRGAGRRRRSAAAPAAAAPVPNKGDTAWMLVSTVLVLLMIVPGPGAVLRRPGPHQEHAVGADAGPRSITCIVMIVWALWGYSLAFTDGGGLNTYVGGFSKAFLQGVTTSTDGRDLLARRGHPGDRLRVLPDDLRGHHHRPGRRRLRRAHEVLGAVCCSPSCGSPSSTSRSPTWCGGGPDRSSPRPIRLKRPLPAPG